MANTIYHLGHEPSALQLYENAYVITNAVAFDPNYSRCALQFQYFAYARRTFSPNLNPAADDGIWVHLLFTGLGRGAGTDFITFFDDDLFSARLQWGPIGAASGERSLSAILYNAVGELPITVNGSYVPEGWFAGSSLVALDLHYYSNNGTSTLEVYLNPGQVWGTEPYLVATYPSAQPRAFKYVWLGAIHIGWASAYSISELAITNFDTRGLRVWTIPVTGAGTYSESTGGWDSVEEMTPDANGALFDAHGQRLLCANSGMSMVPEQIHGIALAGRVSSDPDSSLYPMIRVGGEDFVGETPLTQGNPQPTANVQIYQTNPLTGLPWAGDLSPVQFGVRSALAPIPQ